MSNLIVPLKSDLYEILECYTDFEFYNYEAEIHGGLSQRFYEKIDLIKASIRSENLADDELMIMNQSCLLKYYIRKKGLNFQVDLKNK